MLDLLITGGVVVMPGEAAVVDIGVHRTGASWPSARRAP